MLLTSVLAQASAASRTVTDALEVIEVVMEYVGTVAFAVSGAAVAVQKRMDIVGVVVLGTVVSIGGGTMRDLLVGEQVFWVSSPAFVLVGAAAALLVAFGRVRRFVQRQDDRFQVVQLSDAAGLALFVVVGTNVALDAGANAVAATIIGVIAGVGGGVLRDVLANQIPSVLSERQIYATAALAGAALYVLLLELDLPADAVFWIPVVLIAGLRVLALTTDLRVPGFGHAEDGGADDAPGPAGHD